MPEKFHACFISYRHPAKINGREEKLINLIVDAISEHVQFYTHEHEVFFDRRRLVPGYQYDKQLAEAICRSACMVIVFWPSYLESDNCQKEIRAMLECEQKRRDILGDKLHGYRLFIPVMVRGNYEDLPEDVTKDCHYLDYKAQASRPNVSIGDDEKTSEELFRIAAYIKSLCDMMKSESDRLFDKCKEYGFPRPSSPAAPKEIQAAPTQPFPGR